MENDQLFDAEAAGVYLGGTKPIAKQTLAIWRVYEKGPRFIRLSGKAIRYRRSDLDAWLAARPSLSSTSQMAA